MIINLVSNLDESFKIDKFYAYNHVIAWNLRKTLIELGVDVNMIRDTRFLRQQDPPRGTHTVVISNIAMRAARDDPFFLEKLRGITEDKLILWLDAPFREWDRVFDRILTVVPPYKSSSDAYHWVGYAADPKIFKPEKGEKTVFVDAYPRGWYDGHFDFIYREIQEVLEASGLRILQPIPEYNNGRITWPQMAEMFNQSQFYICTQIGNFGLTNIEAYTSGALLIINNKLNRQDTWPFPMEYAGWSTKEELAEILAQDTDVDAIREKALEHTWEKVATRLLEAL